MAQGLVLVLIRLHLWFCAVRDHHANSHAKKGWEMFTDAAIRAVSQKQSGVVFLLWGNSAQEKTRCSFSFYISCSIRIVVLLVLDWITCFMEDLMSTQRSSVLPLVRFSTREWSQLFLLTPMFFLLFWGLSSMLVS